MATADDGRREGGGQEGDEDEPGERGAGDPDRLGLTKRMVAVHRLGP